ncbi:MAG: nitrite/sulfite reductase, partial [Deinococcus sp.]
ETKARTAGLLDHLEAEGLALPQLPVTINLTGCSNACTRYQVADLGFMGSLRKNAEGVEEEAYQVHLAGGIGEAQRLGNRLKGVVPAAELERYTGAVLSDYRRHGQPDETFVQFADRLGAERFQPDAVLAATREVVGV